MRDLARRGGSLAGLRLGNWIVPVCSECGPKSWRIVRSGDRLKPSPCVTCGRPVVDPYWRTRRYVVCSERCRGLAYQTARREQRADERGERTCPSCGTMFTPARSDSIYCTSASRQRAYRESRLAVKRRGDAPRRALISPAGTDSAKKILARSESRNPETPSTPYLYARSGLSLSSASGEGDAEMQLRRVMLWRYYWRRRSW
jgi:hypothetical protein